MAARPSSPQPRRRIIPPAERRRRRIRILAWMALLALLSPVLVYWWVALSTSPAIHSRLTDAPTAHTALLLGTAQKLPGGSPNPFFTHRIEAAAMLYETGKVQRILVSGDRYQGYNEPAAMRSALLAKGVPDSAIIQDDQGYRTLDSVVRAREVFGADSYLVISQRFHVERALFIAQHRGIQAKGFVAADPESMQSNVRLTVREVAARLGTFLDVFVLNTQPGPRT